MFPWVETTCRGDIRAEFSSDIQADSLCSKEPDYNSALKLWMQAETYVPENKALKKR